MSDIKGGIEHYEDPDGYREPTCGRCGGSTTWIDCGECEDGFTHHDCGEDSCCCLHPESNVRCDLCLGAGAFVVCIASREWCEEHPLPGREEVKSTAMSERYWRYE